MVGDIETGCLTLEAGELVVWPEGFYGLENPGRVMRPNGRVAVNVGDIVSLGGRFVEGEEKCGTTSHWVVSEVQDG